MGALTFIDLMTLSFHECYATHKHTIHLLQTNFYALSLSWQYFSSSFSGPCSILSQIDQAIRLGLYM